VEPNILEVEVEVEVEVLPLRKVEPKPLKLKLKLKLKGGVIGEPKVPLKKIEILFLHSWIRN
jgi:hypothetical protein